MLILHKHNGKTTYVESSRIAKGLKYKMYGLT